jgi:hypothetical protein
MSFNMKYDQLEIIRRVIKFCFFIGICALCIIHISCSKPMSPEEVAEETSGGYMVVSKLKTAGYAQDVIAVDSCAYLAQGQGGIAIVNIKDPRHPALISEVLYDDIPGYSRKVAYAKDSVGTEVIYSADGVPGVASVDVTDKLHPTVARKNNGFKPTISFFVFSKLLFTMISADGIWVSDISNPKFVNPIVNIQVPGYGKSVCISSDSVYALLAIGEGGVVMLNFSRLIAGKREFPTFMSGRLDLPGSSEYIVIIPGTKYACIACGPVGLQIIDYSDTSDIKVVGSLATGGFAKDVCVAGDRAYLATELQGVQIIDISNVASPRRIGKVKFTNTRGIDVRGGYVYVADEQEGLIIFKIP